jgi:hypothetical protein
MVSVCVYTYINSQACSLALSSEVAWEPGALIALHTPHIQTWLSKGQKQYKMSLEHLVPESKKVLEE